MRNVTGLILVLALLSGACGGGDNTAEDASDATSGGDPTGLCDVGTQITADDPTAGLSIVDGAEFFEATAEIWERIAAVTPPEVQADVATIRESLDQFQSVIADFDYDLLDPDLQAAMEDLSVAELSLAGRNFDAFVREMCGVRFDFADISGGAGPTG